MDIEKYKAAIETQKLYITISYTIVMGQLIISSAPFYIYEKIKDTSFAWIIFLVTAFCVLMLLFIYRNCAEKQNVAQNVAAALEKGTIGYGVSFALQNNLLPAKLCWQKGIYGKVHFLSIGICSGLFVVALILFNK
jgi:hypothetical protein